MSITTGEPFKTLLAHDVAVGQELPALIMEVTASQIILGALTAGDSMDVHHDRDLAKARGFKDIFMNSVTSITLAQRFVTDWAGPEAFIAGFSFRLERPQYPNDELRFTGSVSSVESDAVTIQVTGKNSLGNHIVARFLVRLPRSRAA
jgi:acyl dehydratase